MVNPAVSVELGMPVVSRELDQLKNPDKVHRRRPMTVRRQQQEAGVPQTSINKNKIHSKEYGTDYEFYDFKLPTGEPVKVLFKGREELPDSSVFQNAHVIHLGDRPLWGSKDGYSSWQESLDGKEKSQYEFRTDARSIQQFSQEGGLTLVVDQTPRGILEAALLLGADKPGLREMFRGAKHFEYTDEIEKMIDRAIAARRIGAKNGHDAEALILADLLGDQEAHRFLDQVDESYQKSVQKDKVAAQEEHAKDIEDYLSRNPESRNVLTNNPYDINDLAVVRITKFYPVFDESLGKWKIRTYINSTEGKMPRSTVHFTLNHAVESHMDGNWDEIPYVIIVPLARMIEENGLPESMETIDTYWNFSPGQDLVLPEGTIILTPGRTEGDTLTDGSITTLNHRGPEQGLIRLNYPAPSLDAEARIREIRRILDQASELGERSDYLDGLRSELTERTQSIEINRNGSINQSLRNIGVTVKKGGGHGWQGANSYHDPDSLRVTALAESLGTEVGWHASSGAKKVEEAALGIMRRIGEGKTKFYSTGIRQFKKEFIDYFWKDLKPQQRRTLWVTGLL